MYSRTVKKKSNENAISIKIRVHEKFKMNKLDWVKHGDKYYFYIGNEFSRETIYSENNVCLSVGYLRVEIIM